MKSIAQLSAAFLLITAAIAHAGAMGKDSVDISTPDTVAAEPAKAEPLRAEPPKPEPAKPGLSQAAQVAPRPAPTLAANTEPVSIPKKVEEPAKPSTPAPESKLAEPPESKTSPAKPLAGTPSTLPAPGASKPSIESTLIHPAAATTSAADSPKAAPSGGMAFGGAAQVAAALAVVIGLIFIGKALARKFVPGAKAASGKGVVEILARHPLAKNQSLVLVRIGSQIVALNQGRESSESVLVISDAAEVSRIIGQIEGKNPNSISAGFNKLLANARMDLEEAPEEPDLRNTENLDEQLEEMAAAKRQLMELRQHVRSVRDRLPRG